MFYVVFLYLHICLQVSIVVTEFDNIRKKDSFVV